MSDAPPDPRPIMETEIREQMIRHFAGDLTLDQLAEWLVAATWDIDETADPRGAELAYSAQLLFAERDRGHREEADVERELHRLAVTTRLGDPPMFATGTDAVTTGSSEVTSVGVRWGQVQVVGAGR